MIKAIAQAKAKPKVIFRFAVAVSSLLVTTIVNGNQEPKIEWPDKRQAAVSLSYDDALASHLDTALPELNRHGFSASFYLTLASPIVRSRLSEWRMAAKMGHELGNHSLFHGCSKALPGREWVADHLDLSRRSVDDVVAEIRLANDYLFAIDGLTQRTFTPPCNDVTVAGNQSILTHLRQDFVAIKGHYPDFTDLVNETWAPVSVSGEELIAYVEQQAREGGVINIIFHGIGADHLSVSAMAHRMLLDHLKQHPRRYWVASYRRIMEHVGAQSTRHFDGN
ncbi:polysaccharide deacetylase family protein [Thalassotalea mangrovi]|uniref:Polysaccharide deacetylase n=1 Tax=Thalassotalea mangrovi TaxID=2572245 RepID=A0A4U1B5M0_9GAMM|nr:polysaccharide deacetylase family protein [Thalassotalea mangrovi]TKB45754.1 polysaccharide deacetylase [Thalassotalea mangrovi]